MGQIDHNILEQIPGEMITYMSVDTVMDTDDSTRFPVDTLNSLWILSLLLQLMRNLSPPRLSNGIIKDLDRCGQRT